MSKLTDSLSLSLARGDALFRLQRALGLIPAEGLGVTRRAVLYALVAWLPIALWALWRGHAIAGALDEPLLEHFGVHVRCLVAIPALIIAEGVVYHGVELAELRLHAIGFLVLVALLFLAPLAVFASTLGRTKRRAILDYAALIGEHGRAVHARWIEHRPLPESELLRAPEIGPVADTLAIYDAVARMRTVPIGKSLVAILVPAIVPMIVAVALQVPVKELFLSVLKALT